MPNKFTFHDLLEGLRQKLADLHKEKFTGEYTITVHMSQGGLARIYLERKREVMCKK